MSSRRSRRGGAGDLDDVQAVVEVLAKAPGLDGGLEVGVGGRDHPDVDLDAPGAPHPLDLPLLEHPQDLGLEVDPEGGDLVQEQGAPVRQLELPELPRDGAR